jgi:phospholipase C
MGYWDGAKLPLWRWAQDYTLADRFFAAAFGGSMLNHMLLFCACAPRWSDAPAGLRAEIGPNGSLVRDGAVTPDGYLVNTAYTVNTPHWPGDNPAELVPNLTEPTIGERLEADGVSWAWYMGDWRQALAGRSEAVNFKTHQMAPLYFAAYADGTAAKAAHLKDEAEFLDGLRSGALPAVAFVVPADGDSQHPGSANISQGERHAVALLDLIRNSPIWQRAAVIVTWDENGGLWDHVAPPPGDRWGPGPRVPALIISPYAKKGYVDHTVYDGTSILRFIEWRWDLAPLGSRDAKANNLTAAFTFDSGAAPRGPASTRMVAMIAIAGVTVAAVAVSIVTRASRRR